MSDRVYLHIGAPKTGTTYLQQVMNKNRQALRRAGVLYPKVAGDAHHTALWDLRGLAERRDFGQDIRGHWDKVVQAAVEWDGPTTVLSSELFVYADAKLAARVLGAFSGSEVHVIYTARDLVRQVPAVWQERVKNRQTLPYEKFVADVLGKAKTGMAKTFWNAQDAAAALERWSQGVDRRHVHVVTAAPSGAAPEELWNRFARVIGVDGRDFPADVPAVNTSLSVTAAELLRQFNLRHGQHMTILRYRKLVRRGLLDILTQAVHDESRLGLSVAERQALGVRARECVATLQSAGYDISGSWDDLLLSDVGGRGAGGRSPGPGDVTDTEVVDGLLDVVFELLKYQRRLKEASGADQQDPPSGPGDELADEEGDVPPQRQPRLNKRPATRRARQ